MKVKVIGQISRLPCHTNNWCVKRSKVKRVKGHKRSGSKVKVTINVKEKADGLTPMSSCFVKMGSLNGSLF